MFPCTILLRIRVNLNPVTLKSDDGESSSFLEFLQKTFYGANVVIFEGIMAFFNEEIREVRGNTIDRSGEEKNATLCRFSI